MAQGISPLQPCAGATLGKSVSARVVIDQSWCYATSMVLAFDGICVLCNGFVRFLMRHDRLERLRFASSGSVGGAAIFAATGQDSSNPVSVVLVDGDSRYLESDAIIRAVMALGGMWRLFAVVRIVPRPLRDAGYRFVARRRYRWFGKLDSCPLPGAAAAGRFLR